MDLKHDEGISVRKKFSKNELSSKEDGMGQRSEKNQANNLYDSLDKKRDASMVGLSYLLDELNKFQAFSTKMNELISRNMDQVIQLHERDGITFVRIKNILRFEAQGAYTRVHFTNYSVLISRHLKHFEDQITSDFFCRIHQSHFVNLFFVEKYLNQDGGQIQMIDDSLIPLAKSRKKEFFGAINKYHNSFIFER
ncbi:LytTr DNA-binding domain-containing protein [Reichenbachiella faecimaris]|uniref:LytTr DNA-binding domain-containing protein n=1 Tax=Reichenbachiella faecimaris TaxID=692418 RepID=A0A1W2G8U4_REIFA|nr:LytTR family DNA-binding domain-containing protein [Reichenbachiella faecimaris]SMD32862.1 LytTr DNA-binding domain-containing protein [Reichenbachiella faecimaris]